MWQVAENLMKDKKFHTSLSSILKCITSNENSNSRTQLKISWVESQKALLWTNWSDTNLSSLYVVPEVTWQSRLRGPLKGSESAQKAHQGSEGVYGLSKSEQCCLKRVVDLPSKQILQAKPIFFQKFANLRVSDHDLWHLSWNVRQRDAVRFPRPVIPLRHGFSRPPLPASLLEAQSQHFLWGKDSSISKTLQPVCCENFFLDTEILNKSTRTIEKKTTKISCGTHFFAVLWVIIQEFEMLY